MSSRMKIPVVDHWKIGKRAETETLQGIADDYGVTRERIRQIAGMQGVNKTSIQDARRNRMMMGLAEEVLYHREAWQFVNWRSTAALNSMNWALWLKKSGHRYPDILARWEAAKDNPRSRGITCPDGRICARCHVWDVWDGFYLSKNEPNGHGNSCKECSKALVVHYHHLRNVTEYVDEKICPRCNELLPASSYSKSRRNNSGLQTYCLKCHATFPSQVSK